MTVKAEGKYHPYKKFLETSKKISQQPLFKASTETILTFVIITIFIFTAIKPTLTSLVGLRKKIKEREEVNKTLAFKIKSLEKAENIYSEIYPFLTAVNNALPLKANFQRFASKINNLAMDNGLTIHLVQFNEFDILKSKQEQKTTFLTFEIIAVGSFKQINRFITQLEKVDRIVEVDQVEIIEEKEKRQLQAKIKCKIFWLTKNDIIKGKDEKEEK